MKKALILLTSILILMAFTKNTYANVTSTNLIDPNSNQLEFYQNPTGSGSIVNITGSGLIEVDDTIEYFIIPTYVNKKIVTDFNWRQLPFFNDELINELVLYDMGGEAIEVIRLNKKIYADGIHVGYAFEAPSGVGKVKIKEFNLSSTIMTTTDLINFYHEFAPTIDTSLMFINAEDIKHLPVESNYVYSYNSNSYDVSNINFGNNLSIFEYGKNYKDVVSPIIQVDKYTYLTSVDNPVTVEELMNEINLTAYDDIDGDLSDSINYSYTEYDQFVLSQNDVKSRVLGEYEITFSVNDLSGNSASCSIFIIVADNIKPEVDYGESIITYTREVFSDDIQMNDILDNLHVTDNYSTVSKEIIENEYLGNENKLGEFIIKIKCSDENDNYTTVVVTIINHDYTAPIININENEINISYTTPETIEFLLNNLDINIIDNYDDNLNYTISINEYIDSETIVGQYLVKIEATDSSGNTGYKNIYINVIDDVDPVFYLNKSKLVILVNEELDVSKIKDFISQKYNLQNNDFNIEIIKDEYTHNSENEGEYEIGIKIINEDGSIEYDLLTVEVQKEVKPSFFTNVINGIKKILQFIWNIISWPFIKLFGLIF